MEILRSEALMRKCHFSRTFKVTEGGFMKVSYTLLLWTVCVCMLIGCSSTEVHERKGSGSGGAGDLGIAGGYWEAVWEYPSDPPIYYGFTIVQSRGRLYGTCFQGGKDGICLFFLENCKIDGNHFEGRWTYPPANLGEMIEGTFSGDTCRLTNYVTEGWGVIDLHRVAKLSKTPNIFTVPAEKKQ